MKSDFWVPGISWKMGLKSNLTKAYIFDDFSKYGNAFFEKSLNMQKRLQEMKKSHVQCSTCLKLISPWHFQNSKPGFWVLDLSLVTRHITQWTNSPSWISLKIFLNFLSYRYLGYYVYKNKYTNSHVTEILFSDFIFIAGVAHFATLAVR